jgi:predicted  nucleic acid-binding Zn-ribbon protein
MMEREIEGLEKKIRAFEDSEIEIMERMEEAKNFIRERESELKRGEGQVKAHLEALEKRLGEIQAELKELAAERSKLTEGVDPDWISRYERLLAHTGDFALVAVENGGCGGCHMKLPPQVAHDARKGDSMVSCPYCGRLLYCQV